MLTKDFVIEQNPWWRDKELINSDQQVSKALAAVPQKSYSFEDDNLLILGPRQVGKTTFMKLCIRDLLLNKKVSPRNVMYFSSDSLSSKDDILSLASYFDEIADKKETCYLFLDEISFVKDWNVAILALFNSGYLNGKRIYLTGSSSISLQKETLPGRNIKKKFFYPMNLSEYVSLFYSTKLQPKPASILQKDRFYDNALEVLPHVKELNRYLDVYLRYTGGYLTTSYAYNKSKADPFDNYYEIYKDAIISDIAKAEKSQQIFKETIYGILISYGSAVSANSISKKTSIGSHKTVEEYLEIADKLFALRTFYKFANGRVMYRSNKKSYFIDPFIYRVMKYYATGSRELKPQEVPALAEGAIGIALARKYGDIYYMINDNSKETDFLYGDFGIEVKYGPGKFSDLNSSSGYLLTMDNEVKKEGNKIKMPISVFLYLLG
ncbi:MAG: ATP-binding protein [Candidatus Micrarchaeota archaeon]|nr:ATP-binding protein [Candidatus Micrarchaeota archaeon]